MKKLCQRYFLSFHSINSQYLSSASILFPKYSVQAKTSLHSFPFPVPMSSIPLPTTLEGKSKPKVLDALSSHLQITVLGERAAPPPPHCFCPVVGYRTALQPFTHFSLRISNSGQEVHPANFSVKR